MSVAPVTDFTFTAQDAIPNYTTWKERLVQVLRDDGLIPSVLIRLILEFTRSPWDYVPIAMREIRNEAGASIDARVFSTADTIIIPQNASVVLYDTAGFRRCGFSGNHNPRGMLQFSNGTLYKTNANGSFDLYRLDGYVFNFLENREINKGFRTVTDTICFFRLKTRNLFIGYESGASFIYPLDGKPSAWHREMNAGYRILFLGAYENDFIAVDRLKIYKFDSVQKNQTDCFSLPYPPTTVAMLNDSLFMDGKAYTVHVYSVSRLALETTFTCGQNESIWQLVSNDQMVAIFTSDRENVYIHIREHCTIILKDTQVALPIASISDHRLIFQASPLTTRRLLEITAATLPTLPLATK